jgi:hypothetical protein
MDMSVANGGIYKTYNEPALNILNTSNLVATLLNCARSLDSPDEYKQKLAKLAETIKSNPNCYVEELKVTGDTIHRTVLINGEARKDSGEVKLGVEHAGHREDGRAATVSNFALCDKFMFDVD